MAKYRKVDPRIWNDSKFTSLTDSAKLLFLFIMTHPHMTALGAMRASVPGLSAELGWTEKAFREAFGEVLSKGMVKHDEKASFLWLPNFIKYNRPESPNVVKAWSSSIDLLPECALLYELLQHVKAFTEGLPKAFQEVLPDVFAKTMPYQEQEQEQEQEKEQDKEYCATNRTVYSDNSEDQSDHTDVNDKGLTYRSKKGRVLKNHTLEAFEEFWEVFGDKRGRAEASDAFLDTYSPELHDDILTGARRYAAARPSLTNKGQTPKMAQGWLSGRRWEDEMPTLPAEEIPDYMQGVDA